MSESPSATWTSEAAADTSSRFARGVVWGIVATIAMSAIMVIGVSTGIAPMPEPIPIAIAGLVLGSSVPQPVLMIAGIVAHLAYGGIWGGILTVSTQPVTIVKGIGLGVFLWLLMQVIVLPLLGWGIFGAAVTPQIAGATLLLHLVYGATLGGLVDRE